MSAKTEIPAWHFTGPTLRDGRPLPKDGEWLVHTGPVEMCASGLHASKRAIDALGYAPGSTICRVTCRDIVDEESDKFVCRARRIDWRIENADDILRAFARKCALSVIDLWDAPAIVRQYLETGDETIRDAAMAARDAAWDAAWDAARAARDAAWAGDAAMAARDAARDAAMAARAARDAAWAGDAAMAARDAAWAGDAAMAARDAAWDAWDAKLDEFNSLLEQMLTEHRERVS